MPQSADIIALKKLDSMVKDDGLIVTYMTLSRTLSILVNTSKRILLEYLSSQRKRSPGSLFALFCISGTVTLEDGTVEEQIVIARESQVEKWEKLLGQPTKHVYSICVVDFEDNRGVHSADNPATVDDVRSLVSTTSITCPYVGPTKKSPETGSIATIRAVFTGKDLKSLETETVKKMANIGSSVEALRLKPVAPPLEEPSKTTTAKPNMASWIKSAGVDPKKSSDIKSMFKKKQEDAIMEKENEDSAEEEVDLFPAKKTSKTSAAKVIAESDVKGRKSPDVSDNDTSINKTMPMDESMERRSASPDEPMVIRRRSAKAPSEEIVAKKSVQTFSSLANVSSDEADDDSPVVKKGKTIELKSATKRSFDSDEDEEEETEPPKKQATKGKWGFDVEEDSETEPEVATNKPKQAKRRPTKSNEEEQQDETVPVKKAERPRKKAKKTYGSDNEDDREQSPSEKQSEPLRQFLVAPTPTSSGRRRKKVQKESVDEEGFTVVETVWVEMDSDEEADLKNAEANAAAVLTESKVKTTASSNATKLLPAGGKKSENTTKTAAAKNTRKGVQSSIMSFFKKA